MTEEKEADKLENLFYIYIIFIFVFCKPKPKLKPRFV